jgi:hypothetical protein
VEVDGTECIRIKEIEGAVPAELPVILNAAAGDYMLEIVPAEAATPVAEASEEFKGVLKAVSLTNSKRQIYTLTDDKFVRSTKNSLSIPANTAYFQSESATGRLAFTELEGVPVGIEGVTVAGDKANALYDLSGKRVHKPQTGIYVTADGQKVFIAR